jgi:salicylate hydroxylase
VVTITTSARKTVEGDALIAADGVWSRLRAQLLNDGKAQPTGHLAYRAVVPQASCRPPCAATA